MVETTLKINDSELLLIVSVPTELYACVDGFSVVRRDDGLMDVKFDVIDLTLFAKLWAAVERSEAARQLSELMRDWTTDGMDI